MDSNGIIKRIKDTSLLKSDMPDAWTKLANEFPFFAGAQWLKYGCDSLHENSNYKVVSLYVPGPLEFLCFNNRLKNKPVVEQKPVEQASNIAKEDKNVKVNAPVAAKPADIPPIEKKPVEQASNIAKEDKNAKVNAPVAAKPADIPPIEKKPVEQASNVGKEDKNVKVNAPVAAKPADIPVVDKKPVEQASNVEKDDKHVKVNAPVAAKPADIPVVDKKPVEQASKVEKDDKHVKVNTPVAAKPADIPPIDKKPVEQTSNVGKEDKHVKVNTPVAAKPAEVPISEKKSVATEIKPEEKKVNAAPQIISIPINEPEPIKASVVTETTLSDNQPPTVQTSEDILELINELPNTTPFKMRDLSQNSLRKELDESGKNRLSNKLQKTAPILPREIEEEEEDKSLMVVMSFTEWLNHFKQKTALEKKEAKEKKALKAAWQKEKLAEAADEEAEEIPEPLFKQAMESISMESSLISESLAEILANQGKREKAISMYKKLSLRNPEKSTYFANRINELNLNIE